MKILFTFCLLVLGFSASANTLVSFDDVQKYSPVEGYSFSGDIVIASYESTLFYSTVTPASSITSISKESLSPIVYVFGSEKPSSLSIIGAIRNKPPEKTINLIYNSTRRLNSKNIFIPVTKTITYILLNPELKFCNYFHYSYKRSRDGLIQC